jgi:adenine-specific DNA-methyltransferase
MNENDKNYVYNGLITYLGNKRKLIPFLDKGLSSIKDKLNKDKLIILDGFSGSGVCSKFFKLSAEKLYTNDLEGYCETLNKCYLANKSQIDINYIKETISYLNENKKISPPGNLKIIQNNYAPKNDNRINPGERVFYTTYNAKIIDNIRSNIKIINIKKGYSQFFIAPLLVEASIHNNTSGVFKGFHKKNGVGHFGGEGENALVRIMGEINLSVPIFSDVECDYEVFRKDINVLIKQSSGMNLDLVYYDPPYNQHPYASNYFMLNMINEYDGKMKIQDGVSGIAKEWNRSSYNKRIKAEEAMEQLIRDTMSKYIMISYNNEGIIPFNTLKNIFEKYGKVEILKQEYNTYRGSRNLNSRSIKTEEYLWIIEK